VATVFRSPPLLLAIDAVSPARRPSAEDTMYTIEFCAFTGKKMLKDEQSRIQIQIPVYTVKVLYFDVLLSIMTHRA
jgi:hypothetical protein